MRARVRGRIAIAAGVLALLAGGGVAVVWFREPPTAQELVARAEEKLAEGDVDAAEAALKLASEAGAEAKVMRPVQAELLALEAAALLAESPTGKKPGAGNAKTGAQARVDSAFTKMGQAVRLRELMLDATSTQRQWRDILRFHEKRLIIYAGSMQLGQESATLAARRLALDMDDLQALRVAILAELSMAAGQGKTLSADEVAALLERLAIVDEPVFFVYAVRALAPVVDPEEQISSRLRTMLTDHLAATRVDARWRFIAEWLQPSGALDAHLSKLKLHLLDSVGDADADWLRVACEQLMRIDQRPDWIDGRVVMRSTVAMREVLDRAGQLSGDSTYEILRAATLEPSAAFAVYKKVVEAPIREMSTASMADVWLNRESAREFMIITAVELAAEEAGSEAIERAQALVAELPTYRRDLGRLLEARLKMLDGRHLEAAAAFALLYEETGDARALIGKSDALLRAGEWGAGLRASSEAAKARVTMTPWAVGVQIATARTLLRLSRLQGAEPAIRLLEHDLDDMPAVRRLGEDLIFQRLFSDDKANAATIAESLEKRIAAGRPRSGVTQVSWLLSQGKSDEAAKILAEMPLRPNLLSMWHRLLDADLSQETAFLSAWGKAMESISDGPGTALLQAWVQRHEIGMLLNAGPLLEACAADAGSARTRAVASAALGLGHPPKEVLAWLDDLPASEQEEVATLRLRVLKKLGDWPSVEKLLATLASSNDQDYSTEVLAAEVDLAQGKPERVPARLELVVAEWPFYSRAHLRLGTAYEQLNRVDDAIGSYATALMVKPDLVAAYPALFRSYRQAGEHQKATELVFAATQYAPAGSLDSILQILAGDSDGRAGAIAFREELAKHEPWNQQNRLALAGLYEQAGKTEAAESSYRKLLVDSPRSFVAKVTLARFLALQGRRTEADTIIALLVASGEVARMDQWIEVGAYYRDIGNVAGVERIVAKVLKTDGVQRIRAARMTGQWRFNNRQYSDALPLLTEAWRGFGEPGIGSMASAAAFMCGDAKQGKALLAEVQAIDAEWPGLERLRGRAMIADGKFAKAHDSFTAAIERWPNDPENFVYRARLRSRMGKVSLALEDYRLALRRNPQHATARLEFGALLLNNGNATVAMEVMDPPDRADLTHPGYRLHRGLTLLRNGRREEARATLEAFRDDVSDDALVLTALVSVYQAEGDYREAIVYLRKLVELNPGSSWSQRNNLAYWLATVGETEEAVGVASAVVAETAQATRISPAYRATFMETLGYAQFWAGDVDTALATYGEALAVTPLPTTRIGLAQALLIRGESEAAMTALQPLVAQLDEKDPQKQLPVDFRLQVLDLLARGGQAQKVIEVAIALLEDGRIAEQPDRHAELLRVLALAHLRAGESVAALRSVRQSLEINETVRGLLLLAELRPEQAEGILEKAEKNLANKPHVVWQRELSLVRAKLERR